jgi:tyrosine aminotransferase
MYAIVKIDLHQFAAVFHDDVEFTKKLQEEENVFVLPGQAFHYPGVFRVVYCASPDVLIEASKRIHHFCLRHRSIDNE